jgi:hypothetical protein
VTLMWASQRAFFLSLRARLSPSRALWESGLSRSTPLGFRPC